MAVRATVSRFPIDAGAHESSGIPWGVSVTPFATKDENGHSSGGLSSQAIARYSHPQSCPEMMSSFVDLELPVEESDVAMQPCPVYVAAIDLSSSEEFLELTKSALLASLEALAPGSLFEGTLPIELEDVMPLSQFLAPVETCKDRIGSALETLRPTTSWERTTAAGQGLEGVLMGGRGFGVAMEAILNYLGSEYGSTFALGRVFAFLSGPPDYGAGQLDTRRYGEQYASKREDADRALLPEQTPFYRDLAAVAVQAGVCVDIFAVTNEYTDLASLKFLSVESGGSLYLYSNADDSTLPQDMYRMLSRPYAFGCVLRLRTSSEFKTGHSYGHFFPDPQYENVQHIICCDSYATYAYDFEFEDTKGFARHGSEPPIIQIAFQYTVVLPPEELSDSGLVSSSRGKHSLKRRLRIRTLQCGVAQNINELYDSVDPEVVLSLLVHKVILASLEQGVREGRMLLHDWLVILTAQYNEAYKLVQLKNGSSVIGQVDVAFSQCPELQSLPRLVFALLRNPLLRFHEEGVHPDFRIYLQCLFSALEPSSLHRAVYPVLTSYSTPDKQAYPRHSLSRAALITSGSPIFFLDAFTTLIVFYSSTADPTLPFPPPHDCLLRTVINKLKQERCVTPKLIFIRGGKDDATAFENYLIEEQDVDGSGLTSVMGFVSFLEDVTQGALEYMKSGI
ncbi:protein transport protein SEC24 [Prunus yedoensis var. nudiflora]|uniref:Protein transport protein SEC24 n=1 Tax=Prunus yedoensis var. nudiflora TaxID=2094558 RepID=A0A314UYV7_PRUYE|nr:protein transport protein SEC24 [Prunus yedoensis var. nudiflora]